MMPNTVEQVLEWAKAHPLRDGKSWAGWCESFVWRAGGFTGSFPTALAAGSASGVLNPRWQDAPRGAIHYWAGVGGDGHVAFSLGGGLLLMASSRVSNYGTALGTLPFAQYGLPLYRGWSMRHGVETLTLTTSTPSGTNLTPIEDDPDMAFDDNAARLLMDAAENARATREFLARLTTGIGGLPTGDSPQTLLAEAAMHRALKEPYRLLAVMFQGAAPDEASAVEVAFAAKWGKLLAAAEAGGFSAGEVAQLRGLTLTLTGTAEPV